MLAIKALEETSTAQHLPALKKLATETRDVYPEDTEEADVQTGQLDASFMYEADANSQNSPFVKLSGVNLAGDYTITIIKNAPHMAAAEAFIKFLLGLRRSVRNEGRPLRHCFASNGVGIGRPERTRESPYAVTSGSSSRPLRWLGALLVLYLAYPMGAFAYRVIVGHNEGWNVPGLWPALVVSVEGATISLAIGIVAGIPLAYVLAHRKGWLSSAVGVVVQLPLALPPLICGILLIYIVGPYTFLGQLSGERLTETMYGLVIAQSFVSAPFLVVVARSAFRAVDPSLGDVAATLGYGPLARFLRVEVPAASDGLRTGMILMWLRAFGNTARPSSSPTTPTASRCTSIIFFHPFHCPRPRRQRSSPSPLRCSSLSSAASTDRRAFGVIRSQHHLLRCRRHLRPWVSTSTSRSGRSNCGSRIERTPIAWRWSDRQARVRRSRSERSPGCLGRTPER